MAILGNNYVVFYLSIGNLHTFSYLISAYVKMQELQLILRIVILL